MAGGTPRGRNAQALNAPELQRNASAWLVALVGWSGLLWFLSSMEGGGGMDLFPHFDKVAHFTYFLGGGFLFAGWRFSRDSKRPRWRGIVLLTLVVMALMGALDEWHQCFTPGRSGADPWDWLADVSGAVAGALALKAVHRRLQ